MDPGRPDAVCPACSKPVRSGALRVLEDGAFYHVYCRSQQLRLQALEQVDRAQVAHARAASLTEEATRRRERATVPDGPGAAGLCPVCQEPARVIDWRPGADWLAIDGCPCRGFFVTGAALDGRLPSLTPLEREELAARIQGFRAMDREAWLTTADGARDGRLVILIERPDRPT